MGFLKKLFTKGSDEKQEIEDTIEIVEETRELRKEEVYLELWERITWENPNSSLLELIEDPKQYAIKHPDLYE